MKKHLVARALALAGTMGFALALLPGVVSAATTIGNDVSVGGSLTATASSTFIAGLQVSGAFNASSTLNVGGAAVFGSTVVVTGLVTHNGGYIGTASSTFSAGLQVAGAFNASSTLNVSGAARFASLSTFVSGFVSNASSSVGAGLQVAGNLSVSSTLTLGGSILPSTNNSYDLGANGTAFRNVYVSSSLTIGGTAGSVSSTAITAHISALTAAIDLASAATSSYKCVSSTVSSGVNGAAVGDTVIVSPQSVDRAFSYGTLQGIVENANTVDIVYCAGGGITSTGGTTLLDPTSQSYRIDIWKH